jgi:actin-related protein
MDGDVNSRWIPEFVQSKKKDDLADTVMQALSFIKRDVGRTTTTAAVKKTKLTARKPTENQKATKYSKSNLAWFAKNVKREELQKDKRFMKDLGRYYRTFEDFLLEV